MTCWALSLSFFGTVQGYFPSTSLLTCNISSDLVDYGKQSVALIGETTARFWKIPTLNSDLFFDESFNFDFSISNNIYETYKKCLYLKFKVQKKNQYSYIQHLLLVVHKGVCLTLIKSIPQIIREARYDIVNFWHFEFEFRRTKNYQISSIDVYMFVSDVKGVEDKMLALKKNHTSTKYRPHHVL